MLNTLFTFSKHPSASHYYRHYLGHHIILVLILCVSYRLHFRKNCLRAFVMEGDYRCILAPSLSPNSCTDTHKNKCCCGRADLLAHSWPPGSSEGLQRHGDSLLNIRKNFLVDVLSPRVCSKTCSEVGSYFHFSFTFSDCLPHSIS